MQPPLLFPAGNRCHDFVVGVALVGSGAFPKRYPGGGKMWKAAPRLTKIGQMQRHVSSVEFFLGVEMLENDLSFPHEVLWLNEWQVDWSANWTTKKQASTTKTPPSHRNTSCTFFLASLILASPASPPIEARFQQIWMNTSVTAWWPSKIILSGLLKNTPGNSLWRNLFGRRFTCVSVQHLLKKEDPFALNSCFFVCCSSTECWYFILLSHMKYSSVGHPSSVFS